MKKGFILILFLSLIFLSGCDLKKPLLENKPADNIQPIACSQEAKICPDGSTVGRTGPNCEFALCSNSKNQENNKENFVSVCDLANDPSVYLNKKVQVKATLKTKGKDSYQHTNYYLEDTNCEIQAGAWTIEEAMACPPSVKVCNRPKLMLDYFDKSLKMTGELKEMPKSEYINKKWTEVGTYYIFIAKMEDVSIVK